MRREFLIAIVQKAGIVAVAEARGQFVKPEEGKRPPLGSVARQHSEKLDLDH